MGKYLRLVISVILISIVLCSLNTSSYILLNESDETNQVVLESFSEENKLIELKQNVSRTSETTIEFVGVGTEANPYIISQASDLVSLSAIVAEGNDFSGFYFKVVSATGTISLGNFIPIGSSAKPFRGHFDGGFVTFDLAILRTTTNYQGLFGYVDGGTIKNLSITGSVNGDYYAGGVAGYLNSGTIENVYNLASIEGLHYVGGIVGWANSGTIQNSYNSGNIKARGTAAGGIAGRIQGAAAAKVYIKNTYNNGE
ncbi:MAG: GLUG motif-containing protein, partial [Candidatus Izemoplasmatales bacterium]